MKLDPKTPGQMKQEQQMRDKATRQFKAKVPANIKKLVEQTSAVHKYKRDQKRAAMMEAGQMRGGFPKD